MTKEALAYINYFFLNTYMQVSLQSCMKTLHSQCDNGVEMKVLMNPCKDKPFFLNHPGLLKVLNC